MKKLAYIGIILLVASCGNNKSADGNGVVETPQEIEQAHMAGRAAARRIVNRVFNDSSELHSLILEANAEKSAYETAKKQKCIAAYDSAFISTIRVTRPDLAGMLE